ncbi:MAG: hypothetical protein NVS4B12_23220 [Ktedonobacteraceae bacterium]
MQTSTKMKHTKSHLYGDKYTHALVPHDACHNLHNALIHHNNAVLAMQHVHLVRAVDGVCGLCCSVAVR